MTNEEIEKFAQDRLNQLVKDSLGKLMIDLLSVQSQLEASNAKIAYLEQKLKEAKPNE